MMDLRRRIEAIDLSHVRMKLMGPDGPGWSAEHAAATERRYRDFLYVSVGDSSTAVAPPRDVDTFWHYHILDTRAYAADCATAFGAFLHHDPYFGTRGPEDAAALAVAGEETARRMRMIDGSVVDAASCGRMIDGSVVESELVVLESAG